MRHSITRQLPRGFSSTRRLAAVIAACAVITACAPEHEDLQQYVDAVLARHKPNIQPLPEFKPYPTYVYAAGELRDPFAESDFATQVAETSYAGTEGIRPPERDTKEPLEEYPLDTLRMVGTMEQSSTIWALIKDGVGSIHRIKAGNYLGKNYGKVLSINEHQVEILEIVPNGLGAYIERPAAIALSESE